MRQCWTTFVVTTASDELQRPADACASLLLHRQCDQFAGGELAPPIGAHRSRWRVGAGEAVRRSLSTNIGSLADGADTAALLLAAGASLANGGADRPVGGARVLHPPGRRAAVAPVGRRDSWRSKRAAWSGSIWCRETAASRRTPRRAAASRVELRSAAGRPRRKEFAASADCSFSGRAACRRTGVRLTAARSRHLSRGQVRARSQCLPKPKGSHRRYAPVSQLNL